MHLPKEKILAEYFELPNHLSAANRGEADPLGLSVDLELEQCWYGRSSDAEKKFASFFFFGFAGIFPHSAKDVSEDNGIEGFVEWRARVSGQTIESPLVIVARGRCFGDVRDLGRRAALLVANRRALWDPIVQLELALGGRGIIALHKKVVSIGQRQYLEMQDNW